MAGERLVFVFNTVSLRRAERREQELAALKRALVFFSDPLPHDWA